MGKAGRTTVSSKVTLDSRTATVCRKTQSAGNRLAGHPAFRAGADIHLVMNTFNRMVGEPSIDGSTQCEQIFNLSDYLRLSLSHTVPAEVTIEQEINLLESYLRLTSVFRGWVLDHAVSVSGSAREVRLQAHSLCLVSQAVLGAYSPDSPGAWTMKVGLSCPVAGGALVIEICLQPVSAEPPARRRKVAMALESLCRSMSRPDCLWHHAMQRSRKTGIAVCVVIG